MDGKQIKVLRKKLKLTQGEMADRLKVSNITISRYESGKMTPAVDVISKIIDTFNINANWLFTGKGDIFNTTDNNTCDDSNNTSNPDIQQELISCQKELIQLRQQNSSLKEENKDLNTKIKEKLEKIIDLQDRLIKT